MPRPIMLYQTLTAPSLTGLTVQGESGNEAREKPVYYSYKTQTVPLNSK